MEEKNREERFMREALRLAAEAAAEGEVPVGAVVVLRRSPEEEGEIVGRGRNRRELGKNALYHAETEAIDQACRNLGGWRLWQCDLYVTLEPCPMCAGAIINARIRRVFFGAKDDKAGSCGSVVNLFELPYNHKPELISGVLQEECAGILRDFFRELREKRKTKPLPRLWLRPDDKNETKSGSGQTAGLPIERKEIIMEKQITLLAAGDICMKKVADKVDAAYAAWVLEKVRPLFDSADLRIGNLECPLTVCEEELPKSGPNIKGLPQNVDFLTEGKFDCAILANNHTGDYGEAGTLETLDVLRKAGVGFVGAGKDIDEAYKPWYTEKNGLKLGIVALCENEFGVATRELAGVAGFEIGRAYRAIQEAKANADFVVVVFHGGNENNPLPSPRVKERYHLLVDFGADAIIGMHPHCPQGYEFYKGAPIVYSVGNFMFYAAEPDLAHTWYFGYLPKLTFVPGQAVGLEIHPYHFIEGDGQVLPLEGKEKDNMMAYLEKISAMFADDAEHEAWFRAWCTITGPVYAQFLSYRDDYPVDKRLRREKCFNDLRNNLTCEAHNELLTGLLLLEERNQWEEAKAMAEELKALQYIHI